MLCFTGLFCFLTALALGMCPPWVAEFSFSLRASPYLSLRPPLARGVGCSLECCPPLPGHNKKYFRAFSVFCWRLPVITLAVIDKQAPPRVGNLIFGYDLITIGSSLTVLQLQLHISCMKQDDKRVREVMARKEAESAHLSDVIGSAVIPDLATGRRKEICDKESQAVVMCYQSSGMQCGKLIDQLELCASNDGASGSQ